MASSPSPSDGQLVLRADAESQLSSLIFDLSQRVQAAMENMLKMTNEIDQNSAGITEEIEKCKESGLERKRTIEEEKERFQKAAFTVLDMLNNREIS
ncbi:hypothetical protein RJ639_041188 [Escallonia herrerae]|uniref:Uncharacterized protein n=1 Tax=Escallonia herrerae TaxID=1293975 RepID=A0AA88WH49_9ASTE|nr:hypothetical protein RJ639_041188 [Escallonia herrerae]